MQRKQPSLILQIFQNVEENYARDTRKINQEWEASTGSDGQGLQKNFI
jgi:hypothetical protein